MRILAVCLTGCILDFVLGDPYWLYHPVRLIGALIAKCEQICRRIANGSKWRLLIGGGVIFVVVLLVSTAVPAGLLYLARRRSTRFFRLVWKASGAIRSWRRDRFRQRV